MLRVNLSRLAAGTPAITMSLHRATVALAAFAAGPAAAINAARAAKG